MKRLLPLAILSLAAAASLHAERTNNWNVESGFLGDPANWSPSQSPDINGKERWDISNNGIAKVSAGQACGIGIDLLIGTATRTGTVILEGDGTLQVKRYISIAHSVRGTASVTLNDTSSLSIVNGEIGVGQRGTGTLTIAKGANATIEKGVCYIAEGEGGTVTLAGTLVTPELNFGSRKEDTNDHHGKLDIEPGGILKVTKETSFHGTGEFILRIAGSGSEINLGSLKANPAALFQFEVDAKGISTLTVEGSADISDAKLAVNLDGYKFPNFSAKLVLLKSQSLTGKFADVQWLGKTKGTVNYDEANGEVTLSAAR